MSLINSTVYGSVTMTTIKATPAWKQAADENGKIPQIDFNKTLKLALRYLGWDDEKGGYTKESGLNVRSYNLRNAVYKTSVFRFPVRQDYEFKRVYEKLDILHVGEELFEGWNKTHVKMSDFGNEYQPPSEGFADIDETGEV